MKAIAIAFATCGLAIFCGIGPASSQAYTNYPFCAVYGLRTESCAFNTMQQCLAMVSGRGGFCEANAFYQPPRVARRKVRG